MNLRKGSWNPNLYVVGEKGSKRLEICLWHVKLGQSSWTEIMTELNHESPSWYLQGIVKFLGEETHDLGNQIRQPIGVYSRRGFSFELSIINLSGYLSSAEKKNKALNKKKVIRC